MSAPNRPRKRTKTFTGCWTCRVREIKCDEEKPLCLQWYDKNLSCEGYSARLQWLTPVTGSRGLHSQSIQSSSVVINDSNFATPYPQFSADPVGWSIIQAQQALALAGQFSVDLNRCLSTRSNIPHIYYRMKELEDTIHIILAQSQVLPVTPPSVNIEDQSEFATALSIRAISRIKLFRHTHTGYSEHVHQSIPY